MDSLCVESARLGLNRVQLHARCLGAGLLSRELALLLR